MMSSWPPRLMKMFLFGGMGCFNDWIPNAKFSNETPQYVADLCEVLVAYWSLLMRKLIDK
jgi:hypothetical protein